LLPCAYDASVKKLVEAIETLRPDALLMTGQAARRAVVCVERFAHNLDDATAPDNDGALRRALRISRAAPEWLEAKAPVRTIARAIKEAGIPARVSRDAGGFVCNHLYFGALQYLSDKRSAIPAVFVHLPVTPEQAPRGANEKRLTPTEASAALRAAAAAILDELKAGAAA
jgi:pyroglutamyl-peptidase